MGGWMDRRMDGAEGSSIWHEEDLAEEETFEHGPEG